MNNINKKIESLTDQQKEAMAKYRDMGIQIGLATGADLDEEEVRQLADSHRELCRVRKATYFEVFDSPMAVCSLNLGCTPSNALYGQHDISWLITYLYYQVELGVPDLDKIKYLLELSKRVNWMWMSGNTTLVCRRPVEIHLEMSPRDVKVLHKTDGMALKYRDGHGVYSLFGVYIPEELGKKFIEVPKDQIDVREVLKITNTEHRSAILRMIGVDRSFEVLDKKVLDQDVVTTKSPIFTGSDMEYADIRMEYTLYSINFGITDRIYLRMVCPSKGQVHIEAVDPRCDTVKKALQWRVSGTVGGIYTPPLVMS